MIRLLAVALALPNVWIVAAWTYAVFNEAFVHTPEAGPICLLTLFGGGLLSVVGIELNRQQLFLSRPTYPVWCVLSLAACLLGMVANGLGFVFYVAPAC